MFRPGIAVLLLTLVCPTRGLSQLATPMTDSLRGGSATIYLQHTLFGAKYIQFGEEHPAGGSYGKLAAAIDEVPEAHALALKGSRIVTHGRLVSLLGAAIGATTFFVHGEHLEFGLSAGGFAIAGIGGAIQTKGKNRIDEAVWRYNEAMSGSSDEQVER